MDPRPSPVIARRDFLRATLGVAGLALAGSLPFGCAGRTSTGPPAVPRVRWDPAAENVGDPSFTSGPAPLFDSVFLAGFECSTHYRKDGVRLDLIASTGHDYFAARDYARLKTVGIAACRDGTRWHLIERSAGSYDFSSQLPLAEAAQSEGMHVIWDLMHYGWPEDVDVYSTDFPPRFARFAAATAKFLSGFNDTGRPLFFSPINEMSFLAWAGGDNAYLNPYDRGRGHELKRQLVRAAIAAMDAIREKFPDARFVQCEPLINVVGSLYRPVERQAARRYHMAQYQVYDMLLGDLDPGLGGKPEYLDIIGANYYRNNQTYFDGRFIGGNDREYKPLSEMLREVWGRYRRPMFIAETGIEDSDRAMWLRYVVGEAGAAMRQGVPLQGVTWYPILDHPGWEDSRHCENGLWSYPTSDGERSIHNPLAVEIERQTKPLTALRAMALRG